MSKDIILVHRLPPINVLREQVTGKTTGLFAACIAIAIAVGLTPVQQFTLLLYFGLGTFLGTTFVIAMIILSLADTHVQTVCLYFEQSNNFIQQLLICSKWFSAAYVAGVILGGVYNILLFVYVQFPGFSWLVERFGIPQKKPIFKRPTRGFLHRQKIAFAYDKNEMVNIIKSPREDEETAMGEKLQLLPYLCNQIKQKNRVSSFREINSLKKHVTQTYNKMLKVDSKLQPEALDDFANFVNTLELIDILADDIHDTNIMVKKCEFSHRKITITTAQTHCIDEEKFVVITEKGKSKKPMLLRIIQVLDEQRFSVRYTQDWHPPKDATVKLIFKAQKITLKELTREKIDFFLDHTVNQMKGLDQEGLFDKYLGIRQYKLYNYKREDIPTRPYTIAFVANPNLYERVEGRRDTANAPYPDPIMKDGNPATFLKTIDRALQSFETNEVLGRPEIWSKIRILTFFPQQPQKRVYADGLDAPLSIGGQLAGNLIVSQRNMWEKLKMDLEEPIKHGLFSRKGAQQESETKRLIDEIDVVYILSASPEFTRSTATPTDIGQFKNKTGALRFKLGYEQIGEDGKPKLKKDGTPVYTSETSYHEPFAKVPGQVALNVLSATRKTFIHEFAHAMASAVNGTIIDEYADELPFIQPRKHPNATKTIVINRLEKGIGGVPIRHRRLNDIDYNADREHPSAREDWQGFFPERFDHNIPCTMDSSTGPHRFDRLLRDFIYDRLLAKFARK